MSGIIKSKLKTFFNVFRNHPAYVSNAILLALATGFEQAWEEVVFKCPDNPSTVMRYSALFVAVPACVLLMLGILGSNMAWRLCQGVNTRDTPHECSCCGAFWWWNFFVISLPALVVPLTWCFVALMDGDFYVCYRYLPECPEGSTSDFINSEPSTKNITVWNNGTKVESHEPCAKNITVWNHGNKVESQIIGWISLGVVVLFGLIVVFCNRCCSPLTYFPHLYSNKLKKNERMLIEKLMEVQAEKDAEKNVGELTTIFRNLNAKHWESICVEYTKNKNSPLSEFLAKNLKLLKNIKEVADKEQEEDQTKKT